MFYSKFKSKFDLNFGIYHQEYQGDYFFGITFHLLKRGFKFEWNVKPSNKPLFNWSLNKGFYT